jgi:sporulation protein YlmC with PRC-barrel domain
MGVYASDGDKVGKVERIVLDGNTRAISKFVVHSGLTHAGDRLVDIDMITSAHEDGVQLDLTAAQVDELPGFVEEKFIVASDRDIQDYGIAMTNPAGGRAYWFATPQVAGSEFVGRDSVFAPAQTTPAVETRSNIRGVDVVIDSGTTVVGSDGAKLGKVGEVFVDDAGQVSGFVVQAGFIFKRDVRVPIDWVRETGEDEIVLSIPADEAETLAYHPEDTTL